MNRRETAEILEPADYIQMRLIDGGRRVHARMGKDGYYVAASWLQEIGKDHPDPPCERLATTVQANEKRREGQWVKLRW
jgi:hypothetical protein